MSTANEIALPSNPHTNTACVDLITQFYGHADDASADPAGLALFVDDHFKDHNRPANVPAGVSDKHALLGLFAMLRQGFPDGAHRLDIIAPIDADRASVYWTFTGTNTGAFFGAPASGNTVSINGVDIFRVHNGQFVEQWHVEELMSLFAQIEPRA